jgi:drug/metabolite transporter (DMT)-like permease
VAISTSTYALATGRSNEMVSAVRIHWRRFMTMGLAAGVTYALVQIAFQRAPVGYVTCLRESSVIIAAFIGTRYLGEGQARRRIAAAAIVVLGLLLLVVGR